MEADTDPTAAQAAAVDAQLARVRIVLVGAQHTGNIGAAARAMLTMGLSDLRLVAPRHLPDEQANAMASGAAHILESARVHPQLADAVSDCTRVYATTARRRDLSVPFTTPRGFAETTMRQTYDGPIALLFGPERMGLTNEDLGYCHEAIEIPANPRYSSLNLAASVQVLAYELRQAALAGLPRSDDAHVPVSHEAMERFYEHLERVITETRFLKPDNPGRIMLKMRRVFARAAPDENEMNILRGILTSVQHRIRR